MCSYEMDFLLQFQRYRICPQILKRKVQVFKMYEKIYSSQNNERSKSIQYKTNL